MRYVPRRGAFMVLLRGAADAAARATASWRERVFLLQAPLRVAALLPVALVVPVVRQLDARQPLAPLVAPAVLSHHHEGEPALLRDLDAVHLVGEQDLVRADVVERQRRGVVVRGVEHDGHRARGGLRPVDQVGEQDTFPQHLHAPALDTIERDHLRVGRLLGQDVLVAVGRGRADLPVDGEAVGRAVDVLGTFDRVLAEVRDRAQLLALVLAYLDRRERAARTRPAPGRAALRSTPRRARGGRQREGHGGDHDRGTASAVHHGLLAVDLGAGVRWSGGPGVRLG